MYDGGLFLSFARPPCTALFLVLTHKSTYASSHVFFCSVDALLPNDYIVEVNRSTVTDLEAFAEQWRLTQPPEAQVSIVRYFKHAFYGFEIAIQNSTDLTTALDEVAFSLASLDNQQSLLQGLLDSDHVLTVEEVSCSFLGRTAPKQLFLPR